MTSNAALVEDAPAAVRGVFVPHPARRREADAFLDRHGAGWCPTARPPYAMLRKGHVGKPGYRFGICDCARPPLFLKSIPWEPSLEPRWRSLPARAEAHRALHGRNDLLSPICHIRTDKEWIRVYPFYPTDLSSFLSDRIGRRIPVDVSHRLLRQTARAVAALEANGILHRDLKASNVLLSCPGLSESNPIPAPPFLLRAGLKVVLADFGDDKVIGTPFWAAPELYGDRRPSPTVPVFGLGVLAWSLLSRRSLRRLLARFVGKKRSDLVWPDDARDFLSGEAPPFKEAASALPERKFRDVRPSPLRRALLDFVAAATRYDEGERISALERLFGAPLSPRPVAQTADWLDTLSL